MRIKNGCACTAVRGTVRVDSKSYTALFKTRQVKFTTVSHKRHRDRVCSANQDPRASRVCKKAFLLSCTHRSHACVSPSPIGSNQGRRAHAHTNTTHGLAHMSRGHAHLTLSLRAPVKPVSADRPGTHDSHTGRSAQIYTWGLTPRGLAVPRGGSARTMYTPHTPHTHTRAGHTLRGDRARRVRCGGAIEHAHHGASRLVPPYTLPIHPVGLGGRGAIDHKWTERLPAGLTGGGGQVRLQEECLDEGRVLGLLHRR